jgi:hypothetical protein
MNKILAGLLGVQVLLAIATWSTRSAAPEPEGAKDLLTFDLGDVTKVEISEKAGAEGGEAKAASDTVTLAKSGDGWVVASAGDYPAKPGKVEEVVGKLVDLKVRNPIATQKANHNALRVGDREYGRKVKLEAGGKTVELIVGSGSGNSSHVRLADSDEVYRARGVSTFSISTGVRSYVETKYLETKVDALTSINVRNAKGTLTLQKGEDGEWQLAELPPGAELDTTKLKTLVNAVARLNLNAPVGKEVKPEHGLDAPNAEVTLIGTENEEAKTWRYVIGAALDDQYFYAKADDNEYVVTVAKWSTEQARSKAAVDFVKQADQN